jgi:8-oxo-dGTP pyrophosphatase MutT (NUDIX family)
MTTEKNAKEKSGKLQGQLGFPYETVEPGESHPQAIERLLEEEVTVTAGQIAILNPLESAKLAIVRVSKPEVGAWLHAYQIPVTPETQFRRGTFDHEVGDPIWVDVRKVLTTEGAQRVLFKGGTTEIARAHLAHLKNPHELRRRIVENPTELPNWAVYELMKKGFTQIEALSQLGIDPTPFLRSEVLIHSLK